MIHTASPRASVRGPAAPSTATSSHKCAVKLDVTGGPQIHFAWNCPKKAKLVGQSVNLDGRLVFWGLRAAMWERLWERLWELPLPLD